MAVGQYAKALVPLAATAIYAAQASFADGSVTAHEWLTIATLVLTAAGVYAVPNQARHARRVPEPELGAVSAGFIIGALVVVVAVVIIMLWLTGNL